jgi:hypothetical protein
MKITLFSFVLLFCLSANAHKPTKQLRSHNFQYAAFISRNYEMFNNNWQLAFNPINNEIRLISDNDKTVFVLISTNGILDQSHFLNSEEVNAHFLKIEGVTECSYSWNNNSMKLVLDKTYAKQILIDSFGFEPTIISNLF